MDKNQALARLDALEAEAKKLRAIIDAPVSLLPADLTRECFRIDGSNGCFRPAGMFAIEANPSNSGPLRFPTSAVAGAYADALTTLILLRQQPGTVEPTSTMGIVGAAGLHAFIEPYYDSDNEWVLKVNKYSVLATKLARVSPAFCSIQAAHDAIAALGEDRLLQMFFTLSHFTPATK